MNEKEVLYECINGNKHSFDELIKIYQRSHYKFCYFLCKNKYDAEDLFQQTWLKVFEKIHLYDINFSFKNWLYTITHNIFKDHKKKVRHIEDDVIEHIPDEKKEIDNKIMLEKLILTLEEEIRIPLILYYYEGLKLEEISKILSVNLSTIKYRIKLAKDQLYLKLKEDKDE